MDVLLGGPAGELPACAEQASVITIRQPEPRHWPVHNMRVLDAARDFRLGETVALPAADSSHHHWGQAAGALTLDGTTDNTLTQVWRHLLDQFGPLPWSYVDIVMGSHEWPKGISFPGTVVVTEDLYRTKSAATRYLYLVHELVHQWLGNLLLIPPRDAQWWEAYVDAITWYVVEEAVSLAAGPIFHSLFTAYQSSPSAELATRGRYALHHHAHLREQGGLATVAERIHQASTAVATTGIRPYAHDGTAQGAPPC
ncbi:hypothetical protein ACH427_16150 [Streptomyces sp. NPDC020379]|uniref:hypothetical protein n=1 Tax=Streptomyces sp. NPDC020379 TaxID=3365071 RepID=UPI0037AFAE70